MTTLVIFGVILLLNLAASSEPICKVVAFGDVFTVSDSSNSLMPIAWNRSLNATSQSAISLYQEDNRYRFAFMIFSTKFKLVRSFLDFTSIDDFVQTVSETKQLKQNTYTWEALNAIYDNEYLTSPKYGARPDVPKVLTLKSDFGSQNMAKTIEAANKIRSLPNVTMICIGIGKLNYNEYVGVCPDPKNRIMVKSYSEEATIHDVLVRRICECPKDPPPPAKCPKERKNDIVFLFDSSSGVSNDDFQRCFQLIIIIMNRFYFDNGETQISIAHYGAQTVVLTPLTSDKEKIYKSMNNVTQKVGSTDTHVAFYKAFDLFQADMGGRADANKLVVLVSSKKSDQQQRAIEEAQNLKDNGINVLCVGVTPNASAYELAREATTPDLYYQVDNHTALLDKANEIADTICNAPPPPPPAKKCNPAKLLDLFFVVDSSASISAEKFNATRVFLWKLTDSLTYGDSATKSGLVTFGTHERAQNNLSSDKNYVKERITNMPYQASTSHMNLGLDWVCTGGANTAERGARAGADKWIVLSSDGKSEFPDQSRQSAATCKEQGFNIAVIANGKNPKMTEINQIATSSNTVIKIPNVLDLNYHINDLVEIICPGGGYDGHCVE